MRLELRAGVDSAAKAEAPLPFPDDFPPRRWQGGTRDLGEPGVGLGGHVRSEGVGVAGYRPLPAGPPPRSYAARAGSFRAGMPGLVADSAPLTALRPLPTAFPVPGRMAERKLVVVFGATGKGHPKRRPRDAGPLAKPAQGSGRPSPTEPGPTLSARRCTPGPGGRCEMARTPDPGWGHGAGPER